MISPFAFSNLCGKVNNRTNPMSLLRVSATRRINRETVQVFVPLSHSSTTFRQLIISMMMNRFFVIGSPLSGHLLHILWFRTFLLGILSVNNHSSTQLLSLSDFSCAHKTHTSDFYTLLRAGVGVKIFTMLSTL